MTTQLDRCLEHRRTGPGGGGGGGEGEITFLKVVKDRLPGYSTFTDVYLVKCYKDSDILQLAVESHISFKCVSWKSSIRILFPSTKQ